MKRYKNINILILTLLTLFHFTSIPVFADVTEYQNTNTNMEESSAECEVIYKTTYDFSEEIPKYPELEVFASGYDGIYDGEPHGIIVNCETDDVTITYSSDGNNYVSEKPVYTDVGTYVTYYKVEKDDYTTVTGSATVKITEAAIDYTSVDYSGLYDGKLHGIELSIYTDGCEILYSEDGVDFTSKKPEYKEPGTYITYYKISKDNYTTATGSNKVTIKEKDSTTSNNNQNSNNTDKNTDDGISRVQTGDDSHILFYGAVFIVSGVSLRKFKRREEKNL